jgi:ketopantoate hydroxymethyltransferase
MKPTTISLLQKYKQEKKRFATITAYDYSFAQRLLSKGMSREDVAEMANLPLAEIDKVINLI